MTKTIALVAHDHRKPDLLQWVRENVEIIGRHKLVCTGTTGRQVSELLATCPELEGKMPEVTLLKSGPLGGDQQLGALIAEGKIDLVVFLWDPMRPQPHDVDVKALLRISVLYNIPSACNISTADYLMTSGLLESDYVPQKKDYGSYLGRDLP